MRAFLAGLTGSTALASQAFAQALAEPAAAVAVWPEPLSVALGIGLALPLALPVLAYQRWRMAKLARALHGKDVELGRLFESLAAAPDGFYAWMGESGPEICSRRLAVLLGLSRGTESDFADLLGSFRAEDAQALEAAVMALRSEGEGFELDLDLGEGSRRVRTVGVRAAGPDGECLADLVWVRDVTEGASVVADLAHRIQGLANDSERLKGVLDVLPLPIWLRDDDLSLIYVNHAYARAVEAPSPEAAVAGGLELASDQLVREARALAARARAAGEARSESFHLVLGGARRLTTIAEVPLAGGDRLLTAGFALDQTRVEELQSELDHHITAHAEVLERLATAIAIFSTDTRLAFFNAAFARLWRMEPEWLSSQPTYGNVMDALRERRMLPEVADYRAYKEGELKRFISLIDPVENLLHLPDGRTLRRVISAHPYGGLIFTYEDVTDTLALEASFNTMLAVQRETLDHLHEGVAVFGGDGRLKLSNPAFAHIWNLAPESLDGEPHVSEIVERHRPFFERPGQTSDWPALRERLLQLVAVRGSQEGRMERQDGTILDYASVPLPDGAMLLTWLDVSDTAQVERALRERNEALAAADLLKSEFIANVSAEVRKPLTTVIGFSEMLSAEFFGKLNKRQHDYAKGITEAGQALQSLVSDILDLATIEAGQMTLELNAVDVHPMLTAVLSLVRERVREKKLTLDFACPLDMGWVVADERRLRQVMFNLIGNAVKFTPPGGSITVSAERRPAEVALTVADSGPGIPQKELAQVFDSFVRTTAADLGGQGGAGLGLALVKRFVELHGGRIDLRSVPGEGTTVTVRLPATADS